MKVITSYAGVVSKVNPSKTLGFALKNILVTNQVLEWRKERH